MQIDIFSATGSKVKSMDLPASLFGSEVNYGLMHQLLTLQQANRRQSPAHVKTRGMVVGSTRKLFGQKHTGNARRGPIRSPVMRGGGKAFGPLNEKNYTKDMPKKMRHAALRSGLSLQAGKGAILGLEGYPDTMKTKAAFDLLTKLPVELGRKVLIVTPAADRSVRLSARNIEGVKTVTAAYLNIEDILNARHLIFIGDAIEKAEALFGKKEGTVARKKTDDSSEEKPAKKKTASKKSAPKKAS